jgi:uncharacterized protein YlxP (DUF503 family)
MWIPGTTKVWLGVLRLELVIPGAASLKDRRRVVVSLRDRVRARFEVSCNEVSGHDAHGRAALFVTTGGTERALVQATLDKVRVLAESDVHGHVVDATSEVRAWPDEQTFSVADAVEEDR